MFHCLSALSQIVLGLMCPGRPSRGGESQNGAKSRRFGMDMTCRAFYEGVNPKTILNNCHQLCFNRHRRRHRGVRQPKSALCHLPEDLVAPTGSLLATARVPCAKSFGERCALQGLLDGVLSPNSPSLMGCESDFIIRLYTRCYIFRMG